MYVLNVVIRFIVGGHTIYTLFIENLAGIFGAIIVPFISTFWVLRQVHLSKLLENTSFTAKSLQSILSDKGSIDAFSQHLIEEFSIECLLSLIEFIQFRQHVMSTFNVDDAQRTPNPEQTEVTYMYEDEDRNLFMIKFAPNVPLSDIVYSDLGNDMLAFKAKAYKLYQKFLARYFVDVYTSFQFRLI